MKRSGSSNSSDSDDDKKGVEEDLFNMVAHITSSSSKKTILDRTDLHLDVFFGTFFFIGVLMEILCSLMFKITPLFSTKDSNSMTDVADLVLKIFTSSSSSSLKSS